MLQGSTWGTASIPALVVDLVVALVLKRASNARQNLALQRPLIVRLQLHRQVVLEYYAEHERDHG